MHLQGAKALVTGAAQGLGKAFSEALLSRGASVCFCDIQEQKGKDVEREFRAKYGDDKALFIYCDVRSGEMLSKMFNEAVSWLGHIDLMVNNAGIANENRFQDTIDINLVAGIKGSQLAINHMRKDQGGKGGVIVSTVSIAGINVHYAFPVYTACKHGLLGFTESWATNPHMKELGIQMACLCPAATNTDILNYGKNDCLYYDETRYLTQGEYLMEIDFVVKGFLQLVETDDCNGDTMTLSKADGIGYHKKNCKLV